jgi:hypothetical protein
MSSTYAQPGPRSEAKKILAVEAGGAATESMGGVAVVVLSILALVGVAPALLMAIAGIVFGAAFAVEGAAVASRHSALMSVLTETDAERIEFGGGVTVELAAGVAGVVLGILALIGIAPAILLPALAITGGAGLILSAGVLHTLNELRAEAYGVSSAARHASRAAVSGAMAAQVFAGLGAVALGILALIPAIGYSATLTIIAFLVLGASLMLSGTALSGRMLSLFRRA